MSGIVLSRVPTDQPGLIPPVHTAPSRRTNHLPPSRRIAGIYILASCRKADVIESQLTIQEPEVQNAPLPSDIYTVYRRDPRLNMT